MSRIEKHVILLCGTPGLDLDACAKNLADSANTVRGRCVESPICVEEFLPAAAADALSRTLPESIGDYSLVDVLGLPYDELVVAANDGLRRAIEYTLLQLGSSPADTAVLTLHPVLLHQRTSEFVVPYFGSSFSGLRDNGIDIRRIVSVHDDIYDVYRRLMRRGRLFDPELTRSPIALTSGKLSRSREPIRDLHELRLLLDWRDRELAASSNLSAQLDTEHLLFHRKGRLGSLCGILFDDRAPVYFSHPISQPRSDLLGLARPGKNDHPDPERGKALQRAIEEVANRLSHHAAIIEPTAIDELRIDDNKYTALNEAQLKSRILPPLSDRWPSTKTYERLGGLPDRDEEGESGGLPRVSSKVFRSVDCSDRSLDHLRAASDMLKAEILRQINVRDHVLAEQAKVVVAYRPYALPDGFEPTGGVEKEIEAQERAADLRPDSVTKIIIVHPPDDERRRRRNQFSAIWAAGKPAWFEDPDSDAVRSVGDRLASLIEKADISTPPSELKRMSVQLLKEAVASGVSMRQGTDDSSMAAGTVLRYEGQPGKLLAHVFRNSEIFESRLQVRAKRSPHLIEFHMIDTVTNELAKRIGAMT